MKLESRMHLQGAQINAIEGDLDKVSFTPGRSCLETNLGKLKVFNALLLLNNFI